jgi:multiple sugar transport system substrate-binding protein
VLDHPHIGEAVAEDCLIPLETLYDAATLARWRAGSIGPSMESYRWQGKTYAVPLDVATQVMVRRPDRIAVPPDSWDAVEALAQEQPVALSLGGPHAFLNLISMVAGDGHVVGGAVLLPDAAALAALARLQRLARLAPPGSAEMNPIRLLETMARSDEITLVPLIFGYVTYAQPGYAPHQLAFSDTLRQPGGWGGVLGGTGIGFTQRAKPTQDLLDHVAWLMDPDTQTRVFPAFGGQPSARVAWEDAEVNAASGAFYANTRQTAEQALLRPRFDGYIGFQTRASAQIRADLAEGRPPEQTLASLRALWQQARGAARGALDDNRITS